ncbi:DUF1540 domain-containing protein [Cutibacterium acnes]
MKGLDMSTATPVVSCFVTDCAFNDSGCTAFAVTVGGASGQPTCATVTHLDARAGLSSADGRVGACQRIECVHNDKLMCTAQQVAISDAASCTAYQAR